MLTAVMALTLGSVSLAPPASAKLGSSEVVLLKTLLRSVFNATPAASAVNCVANRLAPGTVDDTITDAVLASGDENADGLTNPQIAEKLLMARATVKTHLVHIFDKLAIASRTELAALMARRRT